MYVCRECGAVFEQPARDELDMLVFLECPYCFGNEFVETKLCANCGHYVTGNYIKTAWGDVLCEDCYEEENIFEQAL